MNRVEEIFQKMELKLLERKQQLSDVGALVKFDISGKEGGKWIVDLNDDTLGVRIGDEEANCTFTASDDNFVKNSTYCKRVEWINAPMPLINILNRCPKIKTKAAIIIPIIGISLNNITKVLTTTANTAVDSPKANSREYERISLK